MRILLLNQFFWPDSAATAQFLTDVADRLGSDGDTVTVICGASGYGGHDSSLGPQADIIRLPNVAFSRRFRGRVASYLTFLAGALWRSFRAPAPDVVVTLTTPPLLSIVGLAIQRFRGARHVIWEMDVYPDVATDLGVLTPGHPLARFFAWLANLPRHQADRIIVLGDCMQTRLLAHNIDPEKITVAHNWADEHPSIDADHAAPLTLLYSGNLGLAHDVDTVAQAILRFHQTPIHPANRFRLRRRRLPQRLAPGFLPPKRHPHPALPALL